VFSSRKYRYYWYRAAGVQKNGRSIAITKEQIKERRQEG
jgi:uncharacterized protein YcfL